MRGGWHGVYSLSCEQGCVISCCSWAEGMAFAWVKGSAGGQEVGTASAVEGRLLPACFLPLLVPCCSMDPGRSLSVEG